MVVLKSKFKHFDIPEKSLPDVLFLCMKKYSTQTAIIDTGSGKEYSFDDVIDISKKVAKSLHDVGMRKGDVLVYCCPNNAESIFGMLGALLLGGIVTGVNCSYTEEELMRHFEDSNAKYCVTVPEALSKVLNAANRISQKLIQKIYISGPIGQFSKTDKINAFDDLLSSYDGSELEDVSINPHVDPAFVPYSSGTTGIPKGVVLTHRNVVASLVASMNPEAFLCPPRDSNVIGMLPLYHMFGIMVMMVSFRAGAKLILMPYYENSKFLTLLQNYKVSYIITVPPIILFLAKHPIVSQYDISHLNKVVVGAAPVGKELTEHLIQRHPNIRYVCQLYGMTEVSGLSHLSPPVPVNEQRFGSCGRVGPNFECKIIDIESGTELAAMQNGEICVRSETIMREYLHKPEATADMIGRDGDIGHFDEEHNFFIVDRLKELIKVKGFQVAPAELEDLLLRHPSITDCAVIGIKDEYAGELPRAYIVLDGTKVAIDKAGIHQFINENVAPYKQLKGGIILVDQIPKSPSGKILRRELRRLLKSKL